MTKSAALDLPGFNLVSPSDGLAEGELNLEKWSGVRAEALALFAQRLLIAAADEPEARLSAFSIDWTQVSPAAIIYGQAWRERRGTTVHFLRFRLVDPSGETYAAGGATAHIEGQQT